MSEKDNEKKKVLLKVSFSKQDQLPRKNSTPRMVTEWNYPRIAIALTIMVILVILGIRFIQNDTTQKVSENIAPDQQAEQTQANATRGSNNTGDTSAFATKIPPETSDLSNKKKTATQLSNVIVRAKLAKGIWKNEPFGKITDTIKVNSEQATGVFYFTELANMKGQDIYHIWKYKGDIIFNKKKEVENDRWKTYSSKLFTQRSIGPWSVETIDSNNRQLNVIHFNVVAATE